MNGRVLITRRRYAIVGLRGAISPPSAIAVVSTASEEHQKHNGDQNGCHYFLQTSIGNLVWKPEPVGTAGQLPPPSPL